MSTAIQRRRGNTAQHANFTGLAGEITIDTDLSTVIVHDGVTQGGIRLAKYTEVQSASEGDITAVNTNAGSGLTGGTANGAANIALDYENLSGNLVPSADNTYSLGTADKVWKDVFVGPGSLYVNGQKVLEDNSGTIVVGADAGQNLALNTSGGGDIEFNAIGGGTIALKSNVVVSSGISFSSAGGNTVGFNSNISLTSNQINNLGTPVADTDAATKAYVDTDSTVVRVTGAQTIAGDKTFSDNIVVGGSLTVQGTTTTVNSETISLADNIIDLNSNFTSGNPTENAGIRIQRGDEAAVQIRWNESSDHWEVYDGSATTKIALSTSDLAEGIHKYYTDTRVHAALSVTDGGGDGSLTYNGAGVFTYMGPSQSEVRAHFSGGTGIDINYSTGAISADTDVMATKAYVNSQVASKDALSELSGSTDDVTEGSTNLYYTDARARAAISASGDISYDSATGVISFTNDAGDIESVTAGSGLTGGGTSGDVTLAVDTTTIATKAYVDSQVASKDALSELSGDTDDVAEGASNLYFTNARAQAAISAGTGIAYDSGTGVISLSDTGYVSGVSAGSGLTGGGTDGNVTLNVGAGTGITVAADAVSVNMADFDTDDLGEGASNLYFTDARARGAISVTDAGGDGSLSYNSTSGVITYTGPSASEVRAHFSAGDGITITNGEVAVNGTVVRTSGAQTIAGVKTFSDSLVINGNLTVSGAQTILNTETLTVDDNIIVLNNNVTGAPVENAGVAVERGTETNAEIRWNETDDQWEVFNGSGYTKIALSTADLAENTNLYFTDARARAAISAGGDLSYNSGTGVISFTERTDAEVRGLISVAGDLSYNSTTGVISYNEPTMYADSDARGAISVTDAGGDGSLTYNSTTGVITYTGPSAGEVRAHFSAGTGVSISSGTISIGQAVGTTADVTFNSVTADVTGTVSSIANHDTDDLGEGATNLYHTTARARASVSGGTGISYNSATGVISLSDTGYVTGVTAGTGLSGGGTEGTVTLNVSGLTVNEFNAGSIQTGSESFSDSDSILMTAAAVQDKILSYGYTTNVGDITGVTAGNGLTGGGASGSVTLNVVGGTGISVAADSISVNMSAFDTDDLAEGSNQYYTTARAQADARAALSGGTGITYNSSTGAISLTDTGYVTGVTAGTGLSGGGTEGTVTLSVSGLTLAHFNAASIQTGAEAFADSDTVLMTAAAVNDRIQAFGYTTNVGDITSVTAGTNLNGGGSSGAVTVNLDTTLTGMAAATFSGTVTAGLFSGTATSARYADLAEKYATDAELEAGTVVVFGGDAEVTACSSDAHHAVAGVISTDPAYMMNSEAEGQYVALTGRVPVKVTGPVAKGDLMVTSSVAGHAKADNNAQAGRILGKAISAHEGEGEGVVEVLITLM